MAEHRHHTELIAGLSGRLAGVLEGSEQGVYIYLDDVHKACNERFARLLGYATPEAWAAEPGPFLEAFVDRASHETLARAYADAMDHIVASTIAVTWTLSNGQPLATDVVLVPITHDGHLFALHFVSPRA